MTETTTTFDLRAAVAAAVEAEEARHARYAAQEQARQAEQAAQARASATALLNRALRRLGIPAEATDERIVLAGLTFTANYDHGQEALYLLQPCVSTGCTNLAEVGPIFALHQIAPLLTQAPVEICEACEKAERERGLEEYWRQESVTMETVRAERVAEQQSLEARLLGVLREFIAAEAGRGREG